MASKARHRLDNIDFYQLTDGCCSYPCPLLLSGQLKVAKKKAVGEQKDFAYQSAFYHHL